MSINYIIKMSSSSDQINSRSMNGIITLSDGVLTIEDGNITNANTINADSITGDTITNLQNEINTKQDIITSSNRLNANLISNGIISNTEYDYLDGLTGNIQTQIDDVVAYDVLTLNNTWTGTNIYNQLSTFNGSSVYGSGSNVNLANNLNFFTLANGYNTPSTSMSLGALDYLYWDNILNAKVYMRFAGNLKYTFESNGDFTNTGNLISPTITTINSNISTNTSSINTINSYLNVNTDSIYLQNTIYNIGTKNIAIGREANAQTIAGSNNVNIGYQSGYWTSNPLNNTCVGYQAGAFYVYGTYNTYIGYKSGSYLKVLGGDYNTYVGASCGDDGGTYSHSSAIGYGAQTSANNQIMLGTSSEYVNCPNTLNVVSTITSPTITTINSNIATNTTNIATNTTNIATNTTNIALKQDIISSSNYLNANLVGTGAVSNTTFNYLDATSSIQTQLNTKSTSSNPVFTGNVDFRGTNSIYNSSSNLNFCTTGTTPTAQIGYTGGSSIVIDSLNNNSLYLRYGSTPAIKFTFDSSGSLNCTNGTFSSTVTSNDIQTSTLTTSGTTTINGGIDVNGYMTCFNTIDSRSNISTTKNLAYRTNCIGVDIVSASSITYTFSTIPSIVKLTANCDITLPSVGISAYEGHTFIVNYNNMSGWIFGNLCIPETTTSMYFGSTNRSRMWIVILGRWNFIDFS